MTIVDFLDMSLEERQNVIADAKYIAFTKHNNAKVKLFLWHDAFVEVYYEKDGKTIANIDLLRSDEKLDMYIYTMLLKLMVLERDAQKAMDADLSIRDHQLFRSLLHLKQMRMLDRYEAVFMPADDMGALEGKNIPFIAIRQRDYIERPGNEKQTTLNIYPNLNDLKDTGDEDNDIYLPGHPRQYERPGDDFLLIGFAGSDFRYLGGYLYKWHVSAIREEPILIWSDKTLKNLNLQP